MHMNHLILPLMGTNTVPKFDAGVDDVRANNDAPLQNQDPGLLAGTSHNNVRIQHTTAHSLGPRTSHDLSSLVPANVNVRVSQVPLCGATMKSAHNEYTPVQKLLLELGGHLQV